MLTYVKLKNYKSLTDLYVNLCSKKDTPKKMILIYGENGIGKSNFVSTFEFLRSIIGSKLVKEKLPELLDSNDFLKNNEIIKEIFKFPEFRKMFSNLLENIIKQCKTIGSKENMILEFGFKIEGKKGVYRLETDDKNIVYERLEYVSNKNQTTFFELSREKSYLNENIFKNSDYREEMSKIIEKYWGKHSLLALLVNEMNDKNESYVEKHIPKALIDVIIYFYRIEIRFKDDTSDIIRNVLTNTPEKILTNLMNGNIPIADEEQLSKTEEVLNNFFTNLYSDIKQVYYHRTTQNNKIHYQLFVRKLISGNLVDINFDLESTGTQQLLEIFPFLLDSIEGRTVVIDEMDTGIHDILVTTLLENLSESITGQLIITTHNTMLLESEIDKDAIYIFTADQNAKKELLPLSSFEGRIHPNLNIRKRYLNGMYGGVPMTMDIDFDDLAQIIK